MRFVKMNVRIFALTFVMVLLLFVGSATAAKPEEPVLDYDEQVAQQAQAVQANQALKQYFFDNGWITEYPAYYGGSYIDGSTYYVRLHNPTNEDMETLCSIFAHYKDTVKYEDCPISRTEALKYAGTVAIALYNQGFPVTECYVDSKTSDIIIGMQEDKIDEASVWLDEQKFETTSEYTPPVIFRRGEHYEPLVSENFEPLRGGSDIVIRAGSSVGVCGYYEGSKALVTCGHGGHAVGDYVRSDDELIGIVREVHYSFFEAGDFSIVELFDDNDNDVPITHKVGFGNGTITLTDGVFYSPDVGTAITKYGTRGGYAYGTVIATDVSMFSYGVYIMGLTKVNLTDGMCLGGDSGGPVMVGNAFCGVVSGLVSSTSENAFTFTPYSLIARVGFEAIAAHNCINWVDEDAYYHTSYCSICEDIIYELHDAYWNHTLGQCNRCGRTSPILV